MGTPRWRAASASERPSLATSSRARAAGTAERDPRRPPRLSSSTVSRRFIRASARKLRAFLDRRLERADLVALVLDGKTFAEDAMVLAVGITLQGEKRLLGFVQTATENEPACAAFLRALVERGFRYQPGLLCVIDGATGLRKALQTVFGSHAVVQRCQWHKRENVVAYLPKGHQAAWRRKLQHAYERPRYAEAKAALLRCRQELRLLNESAVTSLDEGFEETLTLHRLGVFGVLGTSLKTTNCLESINALVGQRTDKVDHWRTSDQKQRCWRPRSWTSSPGCDASRGIAPSRSSARRSKRRSERRRPP